MDETGTTERRGTTLTGAMIFRGTRDHPPPLHKNGTQGHLRRF